eukprot:5508840-Karenia_brevis.AAC.1
MVKPRCAGRAKSPLPTLRTTAEASHTSLAHLQIGAELAATAMSKLLSVNTVSRDRPCTRGVEHAAAVRLKLLR